MRRRTPTPMISGESSVPSSGVWKDTHPGRSKGLISIGARMALRPGHEGGVGGARSPQVAKIHEYEVKQYPYSMCGYFPMRALLRGPSGSGKTTLLHTVR